MSQMLVGEYLLRRVHELGIKSIFGVPGDYELAFLDLVLEQGFSWKGNANELVAAYAADGYARVHGTASALITTFGPGETSALCGLAGAYTEFVPVVHIVGYPSMKAQRKHAILHHTLGEGKFHNYHEMSKQISCATTVLEDAATAAAEIDRVLNAMLYHSQPVYIGVPTDIAFESISGHSLLVPLKTALDPNDEALQAKILAEIRGKIESSQRPVIVVDGGATRHRCLDETSALVDAMKVPFFTTPMAKGAINEQNGLFAGVYQGMGSKKDVIAAVESSDCVLWVGNYPADFNTGEFTDNVSQDVRVDFDRFFITVGSQKYSLKMKYVLAALVQSLKASPIPRAAASLLSTPYAAHPPPESIITQKWLWPAFSKFMREGDMANIETGTAQVGFQETALPAKVTAWTQEVFGSIGYATGAMVGASVAHVERGDKRSILITGDGSLQLTVQAFADLLRHGTNPIVFVLNNDGYTVERTIHGAEQPYNDIPMWNYTDAFNFFGPKIKSESYTVRTPAELDALLSDPKFGDPTCPKLVEIMMEKMDAPLALQLAGAAVDKLNKAS